MNPSLILAEFSVECIDLTGQQLVVFVPEQQLHVSGVTAAQHGASLFPTCSEPNVLGNIGHTWPAPSAVIRCEIGVGTSLLPAPDGCLPPVDLQQPLVALK